MHNLCRYLYSTGSQQSCKFCLLIPTNNLINNVMFHWYKSLLIDNYLICMHSVLGPKNKNILTFFLLLKSAFFHPREVIAVSQDKLGKMGRRVVCIT